MSDQGRTLEGVSPSRNEVAWTAASLASGLAIVVVSVVADGPPDSIWGWATLAAVPLYLLALTLVPGVRAAPADASPGGPAVRPVRPADPRPTGVDRSTGLLVGVGLMVLGAGLGVLLAPTAAGTTLSWLVLPATFIVAALGAAWLFRRDDSMTRRAGALVSLINTFPMAVFLGIQSGQLFI